MPDAPDTPVAAWSVPTETYADHVVLRPPNRLIERATRNVGPKDTTDYEAIARAETALEMLSPEFGAWMEAELETLETARAALATARDAATAERLYRSAHDLRGQSATFGFPLAGEIADGLCLLLDAPGALAQQIRIDRHVEAIRAVVRENVRDRDHPTGAELARGLAKLRGSGRGVGGRA